MIVLYAIFLALALSFILIGPTVANLISFSAGFLFGVLNFLLTVKSSTLILSKKGVANPRALIVIKLLFLLVGLSVLTASFPDSLEWVTGGFLFSLIFTIVYFLSNQSGFKK